MKNKNKLSFSNIKDRYKSTSPPFFVKIQNICLMVGGVSVAALVALASLPIAVPVIVTSILGYGVALGVFGAGLAKLPIQDTIK